MELEGKRVLVIGVGLSGTSAAKEIKREGGDVILFDSKKREDFASEKLAELAQLSKMGITIAFGDILLDDIDLLVLSPAVPLKSPLVEEALSKGIQVTTEIDLAYTLAQSPLCAITGTNGKTTTTTLTGLLLKECYEKVGVGGNIGIPLVDEVKRVGGKGIIVAEISSYQLEATKLFHPHIAAVLNLTLDHLHRHGTMEVYQVMKEKIFAKETEEDFLILNYDDPITRSMAERSKAQVLFFSRKKKDFQNGAFLEKGEIVIAKDGHRSIILPVAKLKIKGNHNVENVLAASLIAYLVGVTPKQIAKVLEDFRGLEHRIEPVIEIAGVMYYNDSKATNPDSTIKAIESFQERQVLLMGGEDKDTDLTELIESVKQKASEIILFGKAKDRFFMEAKKNGYPLEHIHIVHGTLKEAVELAKKLAKKGEVVLFSPACASFDMFSGFEERGRVFKEIVRSLQD